MKEIVHLLTAHIDCATLRSYICTLCHDRYAPGLYTYEERKVTCPDCIRLMEEEGKIDNK